MGGKLWDPERSSYRTGAELHRLVPWHPVDGVLPPIKNRLVHLGINLAQGVVGFRYSSLWMAAIGRYSIRRLRASAHVSAIVKRYRLGHHSA
jgi:hypothetical protein